MPVFERECILPVSAAEAYAWHTRPGAFERLRPPWQRVRVVRRAHGVGDGERMVMHVGVGPVTRRWVAVHRDNVPGVQFADEQVQGPFARWVHTHRFEPLPDGTCRLIDHVEYELPGGRPGAAVAGGPMEKMLTRLFAFRHERTAADLARHAEYRDTPRLRVAITGASGMIGTELAAFLESGGHEVLRLVRRVPRGPGEIRWDPDAHRVTDPAALEGLDAVVHLAGANIGKRWTAARKRAIRESRVNGTATVAGALAGLERPPELLLSASGMTIYGDRGDEELPETSSLGAGFLPDVARAWEELMGPAREAGIRTVLARNSLVISGRGGALGPMLPAFKAGLGGPIGSGRQWVSWIALEDWIGAAYRLMHDEAIEGPVNMASPQAVRQREFARTLGKVLRRPAVLPLPAAAVRAAFGEMGESLLLYSIRVRPDRLLEGGFPYRYPDLESALRAELGVLPA
jgi:uncharacterized protein (TIGR01777 family)